LAMHQSGPYQIQAAIAAVHSEAAYASDTDWMQILILYDVLYSLLPSPVIALNRAVALAMAEGPQQGLRLLDQLESDEMLKDYYLFHAARADLLRRTGWLDEALAAYKQALALCQNGAEQAFLSRRIAEVEQQITR
jgi:RNA polymerase sigma-70 factor, ECF subfamily